MGITHYPIQFLSHFLDKKTKAKKKKSDLLGL